MKNTILFVHQSADLYGSDRVLLGLVTMLDREKFHPIVLLPAGGPLVEELLSAGVEYHIIPITRLARSTLSITGILNLPANLVRSFRALSHAVVGRKIDVVHSNTLAVLTGAIWARWHRVPHVWHVHEIIENPKIVRKVYSFLLTWFADRILCVSNAAKQNLILDASALEKRIEVVWNGLTRNANKNIEAATQFRREIGAEKDDVVVALVGRLNRWKGQRLLVSAADLLFQQGVRNIRFVIVGSVVPGQEYYLRDLLQQINHSKFKGRFTVIPFVANVWPVWDGCDIAVVPSTEPEPFGMVALEAMAASRPVVAAGHGGLSEIVVQGETGFLFSPGDAFELAKAIKTLAVDSTLRSEMGRRGFLRYKSKFTLEHYSKNMAKVYQRIIDTTFNGAMAKL